MKHTNLFYSLFFMTILFFNVVFAQKWYFPLGLTYQDGNSELVNYMEEMYETDISLSSPIGVNFQPYYNFRFGLRIGFGLGPVTLILGNDFDNSYIDLPVNFNIGYTILPKFNYSPYVRTGIIYRLAAGLDIEKRAPGFLVAVGMELFRKKPVGLGIEIGYDFSEVEFKYDYYDYYDWYYVEGVTERIRPGQFLLGVYAIF